MDAPRSWNDSLQFYRRVAGRFPRLDPEEEERLARLVAEGRRATAALADPDVSPQRRDELAECERRGREAGEQIVLAHLRMVLPMARRWAWLARLRGLEPCDLVQEGNLGLLGAVEEFATGYGRFSSFAKVWVRQKIQRALSQQGRLVRIPVYVQEKLDRLRQKERKLVAEMGRPPTPEELAAELGIDIAALSRLRLAEREVVSLQQPVPGGEDETLYEDFLEDAESAAFADRTRDRQWLARLLAGLDERSRRVLQWRHGHGLTLDEVGSRESVTPQRIRQIEQEALASVRSRAKSRRS